MNNNPAPPSGPASNYAVPPPPPVQPTTPVPNVPTAPLQTEWKTKFPATLTGFLSFLQGIACIAIIGCELGSVLFDMITATIYVGFWAGIFLMIAWISQASASCCNRDRGCATYTLVFQCIGLFLSLCIIGFDAYFIMNPSTCFYTTSMCSSTGSSRGAFYSVSGSGDLKMSLIKGQLGAGCAMFLLCLIYIIIYIVTANRVKQSKNSPIVHPESQSPLPLLPTGPDGMIKAPPVTNIRSQKASSPLYYRPTMVVDMGDGRSNDLACPTCSTTMAVTVRKK